MLRATDLIFQTVFNILFFLYRLAPYRVDHPFAGRVILAFGKRRSPYIKQQTISSCDAVTAEY